MIANGGIETYDDYQRCLEITQADAVMSAGTREGVVEGWGGGRVVRMFVAVWVDDICSMWISLLHFWLFCCFFCATAS